jgi:glycosyltransferase involved in cell wall biosynthesis
MYDNREVDAVIISSIVTESGEKEGIPVALMEGMAHGLPVIGTSIGSIPELLKDNAGIIIKDKSPESIADAILSLACDMDFYTTISKNGYNRVKCLFNDKLITGTLISMFSVK